MGRREEEGLAGKGRRRTCLDGAARKKQAMREFLFGSSSSKFNVLSSK